MRVLANLLRNEIRYSPDGGDILVGSRLTPDSVSLSVTDNGIGLPPDALGRIFELFQREHTSDSDGGLGIGLWIAREIVERHAGRIDVFSGGKGQGATFTVRLPLALLVTQ